ncbi:MAG TPA: Kdo hydroxylase family protein, partial [Oculatellaceae cyanobacterium]
MASRLESFATSRETLHYEVWDTATGNTLGTLDPADYNAVCRCLEAGGIIYFPESPVMPSPEDREFLLSQRQLEVAYHKNIAYRPMEDRLTGVDKKDADYERLYR